MHIALVTETFPPEINGVAMTLHRIVEGMVQAGYRVDVIRPRQSRADRPSAEHDGALVQVTVPGMPLPRYQGLHFGLPAKGRLTRRWRRETPDVVHIATEGPLGWSAQRAARRLDLPTTSSFHTNFHQYGKHYGYGFLARPLMAYMRRFHNAMSCTMVPTRDVRDQLVAAGFERVTVLSRGVDTQRFSPTHRSDELRRQWGVGEAELVLIYVGRVAGEKNIPLAMRAFERIREHRPEARMVIVGDGPMRASLEREHAGLIFAGMQRGDALAQHYASADLFVFPSMSETFGNVVSEAMASGLAVVAFDYAGPRQLIRSGENGVTVPFNDENAFIAAAVQLDAQPERVRAMGAAARGTAEGLTWPAVVREFAALLEAAAKKDSFPQDGSHIMSA